MEDLEEFQNCDYEFEDDYCESNDENLNKLHETNFVSYSPLEPFKMYHCEFIEFENRYCDNEKYLFLNFQCYENGKYLGVRSLLIGPATIIDDEVENKSFKIRTKNIKPNGYPIFEIVE